MRSFWFRFDTLHDPKWSQFEQGVGVIPRSESQALAAIRSDLYPHGDIPPVADVVVDIDPASLSQDHRPAAGATGIWWPRGFERWQGG
jgi:hypothetical protein